MRCSIKTIKLCAGLACLAILPGSLYLCLRASVSPGERTVRELRQELHVGQGKMEVEIILDRHKIEYGFHSAERQFTGIVRNVSSDGLISSSVQIFVNLDSNNQVAEILMPKVFTGP